MTPQLQAQIRAAQIGDQPAMENLLQENTPLVWSVAKRFYGRGCEPEDLFQLGAIGLLKAIRAFDLQRPVDLSTYAVPMIMGEILPAGSEGRVVEGLALQEAISRLEPQLRQVILLRYMRDLTQQKIAVILGITQVQVSRLEKKARLQLQNALRE